MTDKDVTTEEVESFSYSEAELLKGYDPDALDEQAFKQRYAGIYQKDNGKRLSKSSMRGIWRRFLRYERHDFLKAHKNLTMYDIARVGVDKFIYTMGWYSKADVARWRNNKLRVGICAHCKDQFIPMMFQYNYGLCTQCKSLYSHKAIRNFILEQMNHSDRYQHAHRDLLMDFFIMFYNDMDFRTLFLKESDYAAAYEEKDFPIPDWYEKEAGMLPKVPRKEVGEDAAD